MSDFESLFHQRWISIFTILRHAGKFGRLYFRLLRHPRVPRYLKLLFFLSIIYIISPLDLIPEGILPIIGVVDDIGLLVFILKVFLRLCPDDVLKEQVSAIT